ncbi:hypothetical protein MPLB_2040049 [Mesorhizobium sp. ORS 3324]|nr:hypothetical protein MPLB_2040049 [Mesorhizobium sp. ORS 3324]
MTANDLLIRYVQEVASRCSLILALYGRPHSSECAANEHQAIIDALLKGDKPAAVRLMDEHLLAVATRLARPEAGARTRSRDLLAGYRERLSPTESFQALQWCGAPRRAEFKSQFRSIMLNLVTRQLRQLEMRHFSPSD